MASESWVENGVVLINQTDIADDTLLPELQRVPEVAALERWYQKNNSRKSTGLFQRDMYVSPEAIFDKFKTAYNAVEKDDIVSGVTETTEQLAYKRIALETDNLDEQDIWNQIAEDIDVVNFMREIWREVFAISQAYPAVLYGEKTYRVRGTTQKGNKKKKVYENLRVPIGLTLLDPLKVVPSGNFLFGQEDLIYLASETEIENFDRALGDSRSDDQVVNQLVTQKVDLSDSERRRIRDITGGHITTDNTYLLNPENCWRITATRPDYQRFAAVRMESIFELLDLKHQLREMDRSNMIGATNAIILVKKGNDERPAKQTEIDQLTNQIKVSSRVPIIIGDHRIDIEIITPKTDKTLSPERYNGIDSRITSRLFQILSTGNYSSGTAVDDSIKLLRVIAASMEARRDIIRDSIMEHVFKPTFEQNDELNDDVSMQFYPRRIALDFDPNIAKFLQDLRDRGDISRETILGELDIIEQDEAVKREREAEVYDEIFTPTNVPFNGMDPGAEGRRQGGDKNGGGRPENSPTVNENDTEAVE